MCHALGDARDTFDNKIALFRSVTTFMLPNPYSVRQPLYRDALSR